MGLLFIPGIQMIFHPFPEIELQENRTLAPLPKFEISEADAKKFTDYFNDHFGLRSYLINSNSYVDFKVFKTSPTSDVIIGKNNWLFYNDSMKSIYRNIPITDIEKIASGLEKTQHLLKTKNIKFLFMIGPNKETIYPEYIQNPQKIYDNYQNLVDALKKHNVNFIDSKAILLQSKAKDNAILFSADDTHWTRYGLILVLNEMFKNLNLPTIKYDGTTPTERVGDLIKMVGYDYSETVPAPNITQQNYTNQGHVLLYHDSFMDNETYIDMIFTDFQKFHWYQHPMSETLSANIKGKDIVIFEIAERDLNKLAGYNFPNSL